MTSGASAALSSSRDAIRSRLWPLPTAALVVAVIAGFVVPHLDAAYDDGLPGWLTGLVFGGDAGAASTVLDAVSSSLITVTSLTFSLTVVTLQLASSQFSPRLLRTFSRDLFVQSTLALFLATFVFALTVLRSVRSGDGATTAFVPRIAVSVAFVLALASVFQLVLFLAHLSREIRVETMLRNVHGDATETIAATLPLRERRTGPQDEGDRDVHDLEIPEDAEVVVAPRSGFLVRVDVGRILDAATAADAVVRLDSYPGSFVVERVPFARIWRREGGRLTEAERHGLVEEIAGSVHTDFERTAGQDVAFGLRQLTDVANKALSPGINDPTTAVHAIGHISSLLCDLADRELGPRVERDHEGRVRMVRDAPDFATLVEVAIAQPRRYGAQDPQVLAQLHRMLGDLACRVPIDLHPVIAAQLSRLTATVAAQDFDEVERAHLAWLASTVEDNLAHPPTRPEET